jgi:hypothetical protein
VSWRFLTLSMPTWVLISAASLGVFNGLVNFTRRLPDRNRLSLRGRP